MITTLAADFRDALPEGGRLIGLDVGTKTIGTALCDAGWSFASPATLIRRTKFTARQGRARRADRPQQHVRGLVIGLPLNLDGSESPRSQSTRAFARNCRRPRPADPAVGRALVHRRGRAHDDRAGHEPRQARRAASTTMAAAHILQAAIDALVAA